MGGDLTGVCEERLGLGDRAAAPLRERSRERLRLGERDCERERECLLRLLKKEMVDKLARI